MTVAIIAIIAVVLVLVVGLLIFRLMKKSQNAVPALADPKQTGTAVVGVDEQGAPIMEAQEPQQAPRDEGAFESLLQDEISDRGMQQPRPDDGA
jgi:hypothetical protein